MQFSIVIPTKDRPAEVRAALQSLRAQALRPVTVVVVDATQPAQHELEEEFPDLPLRVIAHQPPSAAAQRNRGIEAVREAAAFVMLLDDDLAIEAGAFEALAAFWRDADADVAGAAFNRIDLPACGGGWWRRSAWASRLGLYADCPGRVARSGWQAAISAVAEDLEVAWIPTGAAVWRSAVLTPTSFDEFYSGYSYLEDLDFSYGVSRHRRLVVVADARYRHLASVHGRPGGFAFGRIEVRHRLHFVHHHGLSTGRCTLMLFLRMGWSLLRGCFLLQGEQVARAGGNAVALSAALRRRRS